MSRAAAWLGLAAALALALASSQAAVAARSELSADGKRVEQLFDEWRFEDAAGVLDGLRRRAPNSAEVLYLEGYERFLSGDYPAAVAKLRAGVRLSPAIEVKELLVLAEAAGEAIQGHQERRSQHFVFRYPAEDEVLVDEALEGLEAALAALTADLGFVPQRPIYVDIYRSPSDLASVSTLTVEEVERTGTIALCKWARLMATSPRALRYGYPWLDSLSHELVHYTVSSLSHDHVPVWMQEGLAKFLERRWREPPSPALPPSSQHLLAKAIASGKLISFEAMHPSMAKLPKAEDAALAFAEVATAIAALHARGGMAALRTAIAKVGDGTDARAAVAQAAGVTWPAFEKSWRSFIAAQKYRTFPGLDPVTRKFRKASAVASKRGPSEDEAVSGADPAARFLRLGNMLLLRRRPKAATVEYEKGMKVAGPAHWVFPVKLGRTYLALGDADRALKSVSEIQLLYPELPWPNLIAGQALLAKGEADKAVEPLRASLATNPFDPTVHCALADAYGKLGAAANATRRARAEKHCRTMVQ